MTDTRTQVEGLLDEVPETPKSRGVMHNLPELCSAIKYFLECKATGDKRAHVSLKWFYHNKLKPKFGGPTIYTVYNYVRDDLGLDARTGKPLSDD